MGTRGLFAVRYKGKYYIKYNHYDSYPDGLGQDLVDSIPVSQEQFEEWLKAQRKRCESMASSKNNGEYEKSSSPPANDLFIEWTYTYDLDNLAFVVDSKAHFSLRAIAGKPSDQWIQFISSDARGERCLSLETPPSLIAKFVSTEAPLLGGDPVPSVDEFVSTSTISPSTWSQPLTPHHRRLMLAQVNASIAETYSILSIFGQNSTASVDAQDLAMSFLEAIVPNNQAIVADQRSPTLYTKPALRDGSPWFWYRGCLILLATNLDNNERFQVYVQAVAARVKAKTLDRCTALLWSVHHVAVVEISGGSVSHSDPIPLLAAYGSDEEGFVNALHLLWHYLPYPRWRVVERATSHRAGLSDFCFPTEIIMKTMAFTDQLLYPNYQFLSHGFFKQWWNHPRVASYIIVPDAEEVTDTSRCFNAYSADENVSVKLRLKSQWGTQSGSIWHGEEPHDESDEPTAIWWDLHCQEKKGEPGVDEEDFSRDSVDTKYRLQRFYSYWPEDLFGDDELARVYNLPRVPDKFSSQSDIILCEAEPT